MIKKTKKLWRLSFLQQQQTFPTFVSFNFRCVKTMHCAQNKTTAWQHCKFKWAVSTSSLCQSSNYSSSSITRIMTALLHYLKQSVKSKSSNGLVIIVLGEKFDRELWAVQPISEKPGSDCVKQSRWFLPHRQAFVIKLNIVSYVPGRTWCSSEDSAVRSLWVRVHSSVIRLITC